MLSVPREFVLENGKKVKAEPYFNENKELEFRFEGIPVAFVLNKKDKTMEAKINNSQIVVALNSSFPQFEKVSKGIMSDLALFGKRLEKGVENLLIFSMPNRSFYVTTQTILDNARYSAKYNLGLLYYVNEKLTGKRKFKTISEMQEAFNQLICKIGLCGKPVQGMGELVYSVPMDFLLQSF